MDRLLCAILLFAIPTVSPCYSNDLSLSHHLCVFRSFFLVRPKIPAREAAYLSNNGAPHQHTKSSVSRKARKMIEWIENDNDQVSRVILTTVENLRLTLDVVSQQTQFHIVSRDSRWHCCGCDLLFLCILYHHNFSHHSLLT